MECAIDIESCPVIDEPKLLFTGTNGLTKISIKDLNGKTIYHQHLQNADGLISLQASLKWGLYILSVTNNNERKSIKLMKK